MRIWHILAFVVLASLFMPARAKGGQGTVLIEDVGLQGRILGFGITALRVRVTNPSALPQTIELRMNLRPETDPSRQKRERRRSQEPSRAETFTASVALGPQESRVVTLPILGSPGGWLEVSAVDAAGNPVGRQARALEAESEDLLAILCRAEALCQRAVARIRRSGTEEERVEKRRELSFEVLRDPPAVWWAYSGVAATIVAMPLEHLSAAQREALEVYARQGGNLILLEALAADRGFLAAYRNGEPDSRGRILGRGRLYRIQELESRAFDSLFTGLALQDLLRSASRPFASRDELLWARDRLATAYPLPSLAWLGGWLLAYLLLVVAANYSVLHWIKRREWAWVTVPAIALAFAGVLYGAYAATRPKAFVLDHVAIEWMDDRSPEAAGASAVRVTSPRSASLNLSVAGRAILARRWRDARLTRPVQAASNGSSDRQWDVRLGEPLQLALEPSKWSVVDLEFRGVRRLAGTVQQVAQGRLRNESGLHFRQALHVTPEGVSFLGEVPPGAEIDLGGVPREPLGTQVGWGSPFLGPWGSGLTGARRSRRGASEADAEEIKQLPSIPFRLVEIIRGWPLNGGTAFQDRSALFLGLAEEAALRGDIHGTHPARTRHTVTVVSFAREP